MSFRHKVSADFLREEVRNGYLVTQEMKKVWACELDLLERLLEACRNYNLKCWADSGTLIGAVRHQGFIPWDDDIDMVMMRDDYDKLVQVSEKEFQSPYFFQTIYSDKYYGNRHAQIRNCRTSAISNPKAKFNQGIFIDIFVYDSIPNCPRLLYKKLERLKRQKLILKVFLKLAVFLPEYVYEKNRWDIRLYQQYEDTLRKEPITESKLISHLSLNFRVPIKDRSYYSETLYMPFEHLQIPVPSGYDQILRIDFGDYMTPIKAPTCHGSLRFDADRSYKDVLQLK